MSTEEGREAGIVLGDRVIRRYEPSNRVPGSPLVGEVVGLRGEKVRVRWEGALRPFRGGRADNHSTLKASALMVATEENLAAARERLRRQRIKHFEEQAHRYECLARDYERRGLDEEAVRWARAQANRNRARVEEEKA